jgi:hypothetical protein
LSIPANTAGVIGSESISQHEASHWKVVGIVLICIAFIVCTSLLVIFWDSCIGFLKSAICCWRGKSHQHLGEEDLMPDWEKGSWELRPETENGYRYPIANNWEGGRRIDANVHGMRRGVGLGVGIEHSGANNGQLYSSAPLGKTVAERSPPAPFLEPHLLEPLARRPSVKNSLRRIA